MEKNEIKKILLDSIDDDAIPNFSSSIVAKFNEKQKHSILYWFKHNKIVSYGVPALASALACVAIVVTTLGSNSNVHVASAVTKESYELSTLSLANIISTCDGNLLNLNSEHNLQRRNALGGPGGFNGWGGWNYISEQDLRTALNIINPYLYVSSNILKKDGIQIVSDNFVHRHKYGKEEYECSYKTDFECNFKFTETLSKDGSTVNVNGELGVTKEKYNVKGTRDNVKESSFADVELTVDFKDKANSSLSFQEKKIKTFSDVPRNSYCYTYKQNGYILYELNMSLVTKKIYYMFDENCVEIALTTYTDQGQRSQVFNITKDYYSNALTLSVEVNGYSIFIDVIDQDNNYIYYLEDYPNDPFGTHTKH